MNKTIHWLSIAAIASVLLLVPIASTPVAFTDDDDDESTQDCVEECIDAFEDAMDECDDLEAGAYEACVTEALRALQNCIGVDEPRDPRAGLVVVPGVQRGCLDLVAEPR